jgi:uncharacterized membrane protein
MGEAAILSMHALPGGIALLLGAYVLLTKKGTSTHKRNGYIWLGLMLLLSITAIFIQEINPGSYSFIHLLIPWTVFSMICAIFSIKRFKKTREKKWKRMHAAWMLGLFFGALVIAGAFTLMPGRMLHTLFVA